MPQPDTLHSSEVRLSDEERERFQDVVEAVADTVENIEMFLEPGDRFAIHPETFPEAEPLGEDESRAKNLLRLFVFDALKMNAAALTVFRTVEGEKWYRTSNPDLVVGTDGTDWWLEFASSVPEEVLETAPVNKVRKTVAKKVRKAGAVKKSSRKKTSKRPK